MLSRLKQITSPGWMHETSAQGWCTGKTRGIGWRGRWEGGSGWGTHVNPWLIHVNIWQKPLQYCKVISLQLINGKKNKLKKKKEFRILFLNYFELSVLEYTIKLYLNRPCPVLTMIFLNILILKECVFLDCLY